MNNQPNNPLHGKTLKAIVQDCIDILGWEYMASKIQIRCFMFDPTLTSSLKFLRKTPWAKTKVETLWIQKIYNARK